MHNLPLLGTMLVTKSLAVSKLVYLASVIDIPDNLINSVQIEIKRFSEIPRIKYTTSCQGFEGGRFSHILKFKLRQYI